VHHLNNDPVVNSEHFLGAQHLMAFPFIDIDDSGTSRFEFLQRNFTSKEMCLSFY